MSAFESIASSKLTRIRETANNMRGWSRSDAPISPKPVSGSVNYRSISCIPIYPRIVGEDSLQALCHSLSLARQLLTYSIEDGGRILIAGTDSEFPIDAWFSHVGRASTIP